MPYGLYLSAEGAQAQTARMETVANNLANVNTPGFKRDYALFQARYAEAIEQSLQSPGIGAPEDVGGGVMAAETQTDFSLGSLQTTGRATDMAIDGDGFFQVRKGRQTLLTRAGNFTINAGGELITPGGHRVLSSSGTPITIDPETGPWELTPDGGIQQDGVITQLALVRPQAAGDLVKQGDNFFQSLGRVRPVPSEERNVRNGVLEMSGVNPTSAMMELIETSRAIEANMKMIQNQDHMLGTLIGRVLQV